MRFSTTFAALCSASAVTALALPQTMAITVPVNTIINYNAGGGILQTLGFLNLENELLKLNQSLTNFNAASLQSQAGGLLGGVKNLLSPILGGSNTANNAVSNVINNVLTPLSLGAPNQQNLLNAYTNVLNQLNSLNSRNIALEAVQAQLINQYLAQYQVRLQQLMTLIQARQADFAALSSGALSNNLQGTVNNILGGFGGLGGVVGGATGGATGGANTGTSVDVVRAFLSQLNINNDQLLGGSTSLVSRVAPTLQQALQSVQNALQQLIRVTIQVYMVPV